MREGRRGFLPGQDSLPRPPVENLIGQGTVARSQVNSRPGRSGPSMAEHFNAGRWRAGGTVPSGTAGSQPGRNEGCFVPDGIRCARRGAAAQR